MQTDDVQNWSACFLLLFQVSPDCTYEETTIAFEGGKESFTLSGKNVTEFGFTAIMSWKRISDDELMPAFTVNETYPIQDIRLDERYTTAPDYLTESELISLMEKHGIGTDASIPVHINNICERNYVKVDNGRRLVPTSLGIVLVHGYQKVTTIGETDFATHVRRLDRSGTVVASDAIVGGNRID